MKPAAAWTVGSLLTLLTLAPAYVSADATLASQTVGERAREDARIVAEKTREGVSKTGEVMTDAWLTTRIHERFIGEDLLKDSDISVETSHHVVTLKGTVRGRAGLARATSVAKHTEGVRRVVNRLTVGRKHQG